ncbi:MAG: hypothetical protein GWP19_07885 [Planctomycetia bacterium]|nr:hypothetical protein [Planctomycetia bacterium]
MKVKIKIGNSQLEFEGTEATEVLKDAAAFTQVKSCGICKNDNIALNYRDVTAKQGKNIGKHYDFYEAICLDCRAKMKLGQYLQGGFYAGFWEKYEPQNNNIPAPAQESFPEPDDLDNGAEVPY